MDTFFPRIQVKTKKKVFTKNGTLFFPEFRWRPKKKGLYQKWNTFFPRIQVKTKKKGLHQKWNTFFKYWPALRCTPSSVARGGGGGGSSPPHWLVKYAKSQAFCAFEADFLWKMENSPPHSKTAPPQTSEFAKLHEIAASILAKTFFFFFFFFFWRSPNFGRKKPLNFRAFRDISPQVSDKPSEIDSRSMKIRVKVVCTLLTLSK